MFQAIDLIDNPTSRVEPLISERYSDKRSKNVTVQGKRLTKGLRELQKTPDCIGDVHGKGLMVGAEEIDPGLSILKDAVKKLPPDFCLQMFGKQKSGEREITL